MDQRLVFCKLGGSVITDKTQPETARQGVLCRLAAEISAALKQQRDLRLLLGHGSGSFGHVAASSHGTRYGVRSAEDWQGFAQVAGSAARLGVIVADTLLAAGVPVLPLPPSASARCHQGKLRSMAADTVREALSQRLVPMVRGDVALDDAWGGTIVSTEQVFAYLVEQLQPARILLVGQVDGVFDRDPLRDPSAQRIDSISPENWHIVRGALGASHAVDVTGGMLAKVEDMVDLARSYPGLVIRLISGERPGALEAALRGLPEQAGGTVIDWSEP